MGNSASHISLKTFGALPATTRLSPVVFSPSFAPSLRPQFLSILPLLYNNQRPEALPLLQQALAQTREDPAYKEEYVWFAVLRCLLDLEDVFLGEPPELKGSPSEQATPEGQLMLTACWQHNAFVNGTAGEQMTERYLKILMGFYEERMGNLDVLEKEGRLEGYVMTELEIFFFLIYHTYLARNFWNFTEESDQDLLAGQRYLLPWKNERLLKLLLAQKRTDLLIYAIERRYFFVSLHNIEKETVVSWERSFLVPEILKKALSKESGCVVSRGQYVHLKAAYLHADRFWVVHITHSPKGYLMRHRKEDLLLARASDECGDKLFMLRMRGRASANDLKEKDLSSAIKGKELRDVRVQAVSLGRPAFYLLACQCEVESLLVKERRQDWELVIDSLESCLPVEEYRLGHSHHSHEHGSQTVVFHLLHRMLIWARRAYCYNRTLLAIYATAFIARFPPPAAIGLQLSEQILAVYEDLDKNRDIFGALDDNLVMRGLAAALEMEKFAFRDRDMQKVAWAREKGMFFHIRHATGKLPADRGPFVREASARARKWYEESTGKEEWYYAFRWAILVIEIEMLDPERTFERIQEHQFYHLASEIQEMYEPESENGIAMDRRMAGLMQGWNRMDWKRERVISIVQELKGQLRKDVFLRTLNVTGSPCLEFWSFYGDVEAHCKRLGKK